MTSWLRRLIHWFRASRAEADLREEMETHRRLREAQLERAGFSRDEASHESRRLFGNAVLAQADTRDLWAVRWLDAFWQDLRGGYRMLRTRPGVSVAAIVSLAIGIGVNSAAFTVINGVLLEPLPYPDPDRLVMVWAVPPDRPGDRLRATGPEYIAWRDRATLFERMGTEGQMSWDLGAEENDTPAERVRVQRLTSSMFDLLGIRPVIGRAFRPDEEPVGGPAPVVMLSHELWNRRYGRDPAVVNRTVRLNGIPTTIVGVMPPGFSYLSESAIDVFIPFAFSPAQTRGSGRGYAAVARLKSGVTIPQAQAQMDSIAVDVAREFPVNQGWTTRVEPLQVALYGNLSDVLFTLQGAVALILLIACANVAGLLLSRAGGRVTEIAVRAAIGAERRRVIRQLLTESALLAAIGGAAGVGVAWLSLKLLFVNSGVWGPQFDGISINGRVLLFTSITALGTALLFGVMPALQASRVDLVASLKSAAKGAVDTRGRQRLRGALVVTQFALAFVLLVGAGLLAHSFLRLQSNDLGGDPRGVVTFAVNFPTSRFQKALGSFNGYTLVDIHPLVAATIGQVYESLRTLPGVDAVAGNNHVPFAGGGALAPFVIEGRPAPVDERERQQLTAAAQIVTPGYFSTMRIPLVQGREFDGRDTAASPWVALVNEDMAARFWPNENPIGKRLTMTMVDDDRPREIVGVVRNARQSRYELTPSPMLYTLHSQQPPHQLCRPACGQVRLGINFLVRASGDRAAVIAAIRRTMASIDPDRPVANVRPLEQDLDAALSQPRWLMTLLGVFAAIAALLAATGLYGMMSHAVGQRTREMGLRLALGASRLDIWRLVMGRVALLVAIGLALGAASALGLSRVAAAFVWGITPTDPLTYAAVVLMLLVVGLAAGFFPTRRALRIAPATALRDE